MSLTTRRRTANRASHGGQCFFGVHNWGNRAREGLAHVDRRVARPDPTGAQWATGAPALRQRPHVPHSPRDRIHNWRRPEPARHGRAGPAPFPQIRLPGPCRGGERPRDGQCPPAHRRRRQAPRWDRHRPETRGQAGRVVDAMDRVPRRSAELAVDVDRPRH